MTMIDYEPAAPESVGACHWLLPFAAQPQVLPAGHPHHHPVVRAHRLFCHVVAIGVIGRSVGCVR